MELEFLILADAVTMADGKFNVLGGGISRFTVPELPAPIPIGVVARLKVSNQDLRRSHTFLVQLIGPAGVPNVPPIEAQADPPEEKAELAKGEERFLNFALQIPAVAVREGLYRVEFHINGKLVKSVPFPVVVGISPVEKQKAKRPPPPRKRNRR